MFFVSGAYAATPTVDLGRAAGYAVLGASTVTNTGLSQVSGNLGLSPGISVTGFSPGIVSNGSIQAATTASLDAHTDLVAAYIAAATAIGAHDLTGQDLGGLTLAPGVYKFTSSAGLSGNLKLDAAGDPNAVFIFQIGSTLITASHSSVSLINGARGNNVFFQVGSSATLGTYTQFAGNILASASITLTTGSNISCGSAMAITAAVTMDTNNISACAASVPVVPVSVPSVNVGTTSTTVAVPFTIASSGSYGPPAVLTQGAAGKDFAYVASGSTCSGQLSSGHQCVVNVTFTPQVAGQRMGAVELMSNTGTVRATAYISGTGNGPQITFQQPGQTPITLGGVFASPNGVAVDGSGNVYVADSGSNAVEMMTPGCSSSRCETTLGGGFSSPVGVAVDGAGNLYVADFANDAVKGMASGCTSSSCVTTVGGGFARPTSVAVDGNGNVYVADAGNNVVKMMAPGCSSASCVTTLGGGSSTPGPVVFNGHDYRDSPAFATHARKMLASGCSGFGCVTTLGGDFVHPASIVRYVSGNVYVADTRKNAVKAMAQGCSGSNCATPSNSSPTPVGVVVDGSGNVYFAELGSNAVKEIPAGCTNPSCVTTLGGGFDHPTSLALDASGNVYVTDANNNALKVMTAGCTSSSCVTTLGSGFAHPTSVTVDGNGNVYVADADNNLVKELPFATPPSLNYPTATPVGSADNTDGQPTVILVNIGNVDLVFPAPAMGTNASIAPGFILSNSGTCPQLSTNSRPYTLALGGVCSYKIGFTPTIGGVNNGSLVLTDNHRNVTGSTQTISLTGSGVVIRVTPTISTLPTASALTYSQPLSASKLTGGASSTPGTYAWTDPTIVPVAGTASYPVTFTPSDSTNYSPVTTTASVTTTKVTPTISTPPTASALTYGQPLSASKLTGGASSTPGTYTWTDPTIVPVAGTANYAVTFTPSDSTNYSPVATGASVTTTKVTPTISTLPTASALTYGQTLAASKLTGGVASTPGTFSWTNFTLSPTTGTASYSVTFTPTDTADYSPITTNVSVTTGKADQMITFLKPAGTGYGSADVVLGGTSTSGLPVSYSAAGACTLLVGAVHVTGVGPCSITATQAGNTSYKAGKPVTRKFRTAPVVLTVTANSATRVYGTANPAFSDRFTGFVAGDSASVVSGAGVKTTTATTTSVAGSYPITVAQGSLSAANYTFTFVSGSLTVTNAGQTITFAPPATATFGDTPITLNATGGPSGNPITYTVTGPGTLAGNILTLTGAGNVIVTANQAGNARYPAASAVAGTIVVGQAAQTITFPMPSPTSGSSTITLAATGGASGQPITYTVSGPATLNGNVLTVTGSGLLTVTANQAGNTNYAAATPVTRSFNSTASASVTMTADSTTYSYPNSTILRACVINSGGFVAAGRISFYDGLTLLFTQQVNGDGCMHWYITPVLQVGTHTITASYSDPVNLNVSSLPLIITVSIGTTTAKVECWQHDTFSYGADFSCDANPASGPSSGYFTYSFDGGAPVRVVMNAAGHSLYTINKPNVGTHTVAVNYPAQGNYGAYVLPLQTFVVTAAPVNVELTPSSWYTMAGKAVSFNVALSSWSAGIPSSIGTVSFFDGSTLLGTVPVDANGKASFSAAALAVGSHPISANYSGNATQFAAGSNAVAIQISN